MEVVKVSAHSVPKSVAGAIAAVIRENGEVVHRYYFKTLSEDRIVEKVSYAALYEPYNWIVGIGTPLDSVYSDIEYMSDKRYAMVMLQIGGICLLVLIMMFLQQKMNTLKCSLMTKMLWFAIILKN